MITFLYSIPVVLVALAVAVIWWESRKPAHPPSGDSIYPGVMLGQEEWAAKVREKLKKLR